MDGFAFENCLLKHYIRKEVWLPYCREQLKKVRAGKAAPRRLRYFTFCAVGALDVLLLDREKVIRKSSNGEFDTVCFFDKSKDAVIETQKRIPGASGFPGDFAEIVLLAADGDGELELQIPPEDRDTREVRQKQMRKAQLGAFIKSFPFDVVNLDVEQYLYRPKEDLPGVLTNAIRKILEWQRRPGVGSNGKAFALSEFTLMFTTQVGPDGLPDHYISYLRDHCLAANLAAHQELSAPFLKKSNGRDAAQFFREDFDGAFKLAVPKSLSELALEQDWYIDDTKGIEVYQFDRPSVEGTYRMLHMAMVVNRQVPPKDRRAPGQRADVAHTSHKNSIVRLFDGDVVAVEDLIVGKVEADLKADLGRLLQHRARYYTPTA